MNDKEFEIGDTVKVLGKKMRGVITNKDTYVDIFGTGDHITDYWIDNSYNNFPLSELSITRKVLIEKHNTKSHSE